MPHIVLCIYINKANLPKPTPPEVLDRLVNDCKKVERLATDEVFFKLLQDVVRMRCAISGVHSGLGLSPYLAIEICECPLMESLTQGALFRVETPYN